jgi:S-adenosylmethionine hydrolase
MFVKLPRMTIITLTTDFGAHTTYVAQMKGVILTLSPSATIVDITHSLAPQDIFAGALALADAAPWFPPQTIHIAVVDPGVGTSRKMIAAHAGQHWFLAPDNGLLTGVLRTSPASEIFAIENAALFLDRISHTFHGRDMLAPVAARLSHGLRGDQLGPRVEQLVELDWPTPNIDAHAIVGQIIAIDSFGNLISNISIDDAATWSPNAVLHVECGDARINQISRTYGEHRAGEIVALFGSSGRLEIAVVNGNAAESLHTRAGEPIGVWRT